MWQDKDLEGFINKTQTLNVASRIFLELNMNQPDNIIKIGNYRSRPNDPTSLYYVVPTTYDPFDAGNYYTGATDSSTSVLLDETVPDTPVLFQQPDLKRKLLFSLDDCFNYHRPRSGINKMLYLGLTGIASSKSQWFNYFRTDYARSPRYYLASPDDYFKYWTSYRVEDGTEQGVSSSIRTSLVDQNYYITDAAPFVVYEKVVATNRIVIKVQTNVGDFQGSSAFTGTQAISDPFYGTLNSTIPLRWTIQGLKNGVWQDLYRANENSDPATNTPLFGPDGYLEIQWGLNIPQSYEELFFLNGEIITSETDSEKIISEYLPEFPRVGEGWLIKNTEFARGQVYMYQLSGEWLVFDATYSWKKGSQDITAKTGFVTSLTDPSFFIESGIRIFREIDTIQGLRMVVTTMQGNNETFDLIEMSPRIVADITDYVEDFNITKSMSDLGNTNLPLGGLLASTGSINIIDVDGAFVPSNAIDLSIPPVSSTQQVINPGFIVRSNNLLRVTTPSDTTLDFAVGDQAEIISSDSSFNGIFTIISISLDKRTFVCRQTGADATLVVPATVIVSKANDTSGSLIAEWLSSQFKFSFYEIIKDYKAKFVPIGASSAIAFYDAYVPIKTMYSEGFPESSGEFYRMSLSIRDLFFLLEQAPAPEVFIPDVSLGLAIGILLDYIGFSNYVFKRIDGVADPVIPYFFVPQDVNVAEILQDLALGTQTAMYFDEYNNLVIAMKEYVIPEYDQRDVDNILTADIIYEKDELGLDTTTVERYPNILNISSQEKKVYNGGQLNYTKRYIQRSYGSVIQSPYVNKYKTWVYLPALLWEVSSTEALRSINDVAAQQTYSLAATPLNTTLTSAVPTVVNGEVVDNIIDLGENVYWLTKHQGYFYANGEIIQYDAVEYYVGGEGNRWIQNNEDYQYYFGRLAFNQKIYPTGNVRIYSEPYTTDYTGTTQLKAGSVKDHGRGRFGTDVVEHNAGIPSYWTSPENRYGCTMDSSLLFTTNNIVDIPINAAPNVLGGINPTWGSRARTEGIIKNFLAASYYTENPSQYQDPTLAAVNQASALVFTGPGIDTSENFIYPEYESKLINNISYVYKKIDKPMKHFGTRMRVIGKVNSGTSNDQVPVGQTQYFSNSSDTNDLGVGISGGGGGMGIMINPETNNGYFLEIVALSNQDVSDYVQENRKQVVSYQVSAGAIVRSNNIVTINFGQDIAFKVGDQIEITGALPQDLNGIFQIDAVNTTRRISYTNNGPNTTSTQGATVAAYIPTTTNISNVFFYKTLGLPTETEYDYTSAVGQTQRVNNIVTANLSPAVSANIKQNDIVQISGEGTFNGQFTVSTISGNSITYEDVRPNATSSEILNFTIISGDKTPVIPEKIWEGYAPIIVDDGLFTGSQRLSDDSNPTVYDLAVEYNQVGSTIDFYIYLNNKLVGYVNDANPLPIRNDMCLFVRGQSKCIFENAYALGQNFSQNTSFRVIETVSPAFGINEINATEALRKYALSGFVQASYLSSVGTQGAPDYNIYYEEFGTIMREAAYFNIKYDRAFPALYAKMAPTINSVKTYSTSGFYAGPYGAEFLIFNCMDKNIVLDSSTGNYLRINGVTFTQNTTKELTVDDYYNKTSNLNSVPYSSSGDPITNPFLQKKELEAVTVSRKKYGRSEFSIESTYVQDDDTAYNILGWVIKKAIRPRKMVGVSVFGAQMMQLGDIVTIDYKNRQGDQVIAEEGTRFVIYNIEYSRAANQIETVLHLAEI